MTDREKVIRAVDSCFDYWLDQHRNIRPLELEHVRQFKADAIALLKAQEPRVLTSADVNNIGPEDVCAFVEIKEESHMYACYMHQYDETHTEIMCDVPDLVAKLQGGIARIWTSRPTDEQREAVKWDE